MVLTESYIAGPTAPAVRDVTLGQLLEQAAKSAPDRIALIAGVPDPALRRKWTYSELYPEAQRTARALLSRFKPGERIVIAHAPTEFASVSQAPCGLSDARHWNSSALSVIPSACSTPPPHVAPPV